MPEKVISDILKFKCRGAGAGVGTAGGLPGFRSEKSAGKPKAGAGAPPAINVNS